MGERERERDREIERERERRREGWRKGRRKEIFRTPKPIEMRHACMCVRVSV